MEEEAEEDDEAVAKQILANYAAPELKLRLPLVKLIFDS